MLYVGVVFVFELCCSCGWLWSVWLKLLVLIGVEELDLFELSRLDWIGVDSSRFDLRLCRTS